MAQLGFLACAFLCAFTWDRGIELWLAASTLAAMVAAIACSDDRAIITRPANFWGRITLALLSALTVLCWIRAATSDIPALSILMTGFYTMPLAAVVIGLQHDRTHLLSLICRAALIFFPTILIGAVAHQTLMTDFAYYRLKWPFDDANHLAMLFNTGNVLAMGLIATPAYRRHGTALLGICLTALLLNGSRAGILCLIIAGLIMLATLNGRNWRALATPHTAKAAALLLIILGAVCAAAIAAGLWLSLPFPALAEIITNPAKASGSRPDFWADIFTLIKDRPWFGYGTATFPYVYPSVMEPDHVTGGYAAHNDFLQIWLETGIAGALLYVGIILTVIIGTIRSWPRATQNNQRITLITALCGLIVLGLQAQIEFMLPVLPLLLLFGIILAIWIAHLPTDETTITTAENGKHPITRISPWLGQAAGATLIITMLGSIAIARAEILIAQGDKALARGDVQTFAANLDAARTWSLDLHAFPYVRAANFHLATLISGSNTTSADDIRKEIADALDRNPYLSSAYETLGRLEQIEGKSPIPAWTRGLGLEPRNAALRIALIKYYDRMGMAGELKALVNDSDKWRHLRGPTPELRQLLEKHRGVLTCDGVCP